MKDRSGAEAEIAPCTTAAFGALCLNEKQFKALHHPAGVKGPCTEPLVLIAYQIMTWGR